MVLIRIFKHHKVWKSHLVFVIFLLGISIFYQLDKTSMMRPQGLHQWRQSIGAGFAKNYYNYNLNPAESRIYNYIVDEAQSDKAFAEFPILYYAVAVLYKIFGPDESIFRILNLLIFYLGLFYLKKSLDLFLNDHIWSVLISLLTFTSAVLVYYSNSFLPDTTAFSISFIAFYFFLKYTYSHQLKDIYKSSILYMVAGLIKVSALIPFLAILSSYGIFLILSRSFRKQFRIQPFLIPAVLPIIASFIWYYFAYSYHSKYGGDISAVEVRPIWILDAETIHNTWLKIWDVWMETYFHPLVLGIALLFFVGSFFFVKREWGKFILPFMLFSLLGSIAFFFLFFRSLFNHDYYLINSYFLVVFSFALGTKAWLNLKKSKWVSFLSIGVFSLFLIFLINDARIKSDIKLSEYNWWHNTFFKGLEDIEPALREAGIQRNDKVISIPDPSINISLNLMNQDGFTDFIRMNIPVEERIDFQISKGAKYLVLSDSNIYKKEKRKYIEKYMKKRVLSHKNVVVYDLQGFNH